MSEGHLVSPALLRQIYRTVRRVLNESRTAVRGGRTGYVEQYHQGFVDTEISAATNAKTSPSTGTVTVWVHDTEQDQLVVAKDASGAELQIDIVNRYENITLTAGLYVHCRLVGGEWHVVAADCPGA